jgi:hypothetical protein
MYASFVLTFEGENFLFFIFRKCFLLLLSLMLRGELLLFMNFIYFSICDHEFYYYYFLFHICLDVVCWVF